MFGVTSASGWYGVLETKFIFLPVTISTRKKDKNVQNNSFHNTRLQTVERSDP
jgi:hypothetical protein